MRPEQRFLNYVKIWSTSQAGADCVPSTECQFALARQLVAELKELDIADAEMDAHGYVYGHIPASSGYENAVRLGFIAHMDTSPDCPGRNVQPRMIENYDGGDVVLGESGQVIRTADFPHLKQMQGRTLICTDGTTLLGADDKAGIAEILTMAERVLQEGIPHGPISIAFTPDEEIAHGAALLDLEKFNAQFAYTMDGDLENELNYETFNAVAATFTCHGFMVHPGYAKDIMVNSQLIAVELAGMFPPEETPANTEGYQGYYHLFSMEGSVALTKLSYLVRDHDAARMQQRIEFMHSIVRFLNQKYGEDTVQLSYKVTCRNMAEALQEYMFLLEDAKTAMRRVGLEPVIVPVRGGTDGARLSFRGLPCLNIGVGAGARHSLCEHISVESLELDTQVAIELVKIFAEKRNSDK